jgi:hypothetical protein
MGRFVSRASRPRTAGRMPATRGRFVSRASRPRTAGKMPATRGRFSCPCCLVYIALFSSTRAEPAPSLSRGCPRDARARHPRHVEWQPQSRGLWGWSRIELLIDLLIELCLFVGKSFLLDHCANTLQVDVSWLAARCRDGGSFRASGNHFHESVC